tara:strand:- start:320 stop:631 length:312 start_codon:yes stop_codon:yes gene_type:complete
LKSAHKKKRAAFVFSWKGLWWNTQPFGTRHYASVQRDSATAGDVPNGHQWQFLGAESARNRREQRDGHRIIETGPTREIEVDRVSGVFWNREIDVRVSLSRGE